MSALPAPSVRDPGIGAGAPPPRCIHDLVAERVRERPDAVALSARGRRLTYADLDAASERLARELAAVGVGPERIVAVQAARSPELVVGLLAVLRAGGCYLALEPDAPAARREALLRRARPAAILATPELRGDPGHAGAPVLELTPSGAPRASTPGLPRRVDPENLAYVCFTSGSTGAPRGVCVPHAAVSRLVQEPDWARFGPDDVFLHLSPVAFDASVLEIWGALANGGRVAIHPPGPVVPDEVAETVRGEGVTVLWLTAGLFQRMVDTRLDAFERVRHVISGGDVVSPEAVRRLLQAWPSVRFTNGYGPTENTTFTTCWTAAGVPGEGPIPIGRPIRGTTVCVLGEGFRAAAPGEAGELFAGGRGLARCYLGAAAETAERFVPDPERPGARLYRTGDRVRWGRDGSLRFLGRLDAQVKLQGYRVEPAEVEAALARQPGVRAAAAAVHTDALGRRHLVGYLIPDAGALPAEELARAVRERLRDELPGYLVPRAVVALEAFPLTPNGKVDRAALPPPSRPARQARGAYHPPRDAVERRLARIWAEILGVERVGVQDDFFSLGGHSLLAAELFTAIERELGVDVPARTLYVQPTIAAIAGVVHERRRAAAPEAER